MNLRNLGAIRTVVLLNGRRVPGGTTITTEVDFNTIPTANIQRIEVWAADPVWPDSRPRSR